MPDLPDPTVGCHLTGFTKKCRTLVTKGLCRRWLHIAGVNPNTGEKLNEARCVDDWTPLLLLENSKLQRETGAAVESFRNEVARANQLSLTALVHQAANGGQMPAIEHKTSR